MKSLLPRLKLRHVLFSTLLVSGLLPLALLTVLLVDQNRKLLHDEQRDDLIRSAQVLSSEVDLYLAARQRLLAQLGSGLLVVPGPTEPTALLREGWVTEHLQQFLRANPDFHAVRVLDASGIGPTFSRGALSEPAESALDDAFGAVREGGAPVYRFLAPAAMGEPAAVLAIPVARQPQAGGWAEASSPAQEQAGPEAGAAPSGEQAVLEASAAPGQEQVAAELAAARPPAIMPPPARLVVQALLPIQPIEELFRREARGGEVGVFLIDGEGKLLWSDGRNPEAERALLGSEVVRAFVDRPMSMTREYAVGIGGEPVEMLAQVSPIGASRWGLVVQRPAAAAFENVDRAIVNAALSALVLVPLALFVAFFVARRVSQPIQRLAETSHEIAEGNFGGRVETAGLAFELKDLGEDFNRMSAHVESHVAQLRQAAQANRDLFIGSLRAFVAAIDAKDPYTRGHSERVAALSRTISRHLGLPEEFQHKLWIGALLHDVGKIGVEDRILSKEGVLTPEEYDQMKMHTVMGAEIMTSIEQLKEMIPAIRWHHESWNGRGYPDGLRGEQIPLMARIVAVADCFDAITTNRPYQQAYSLQFAVETITKLTGSRFDAKVVTAFLRAFEAGEVGVPRAARGEAEPVRAQAGR